MASPVSTRTVGQTLRQAAGRLVDSDSPDLDAELLLADVLGLERPGLLARLRDPFPDDAGPAFQALVDRRVAGEPVAYILGRAWFHGLSFEVSPAVLIPRPETELLVDWGLACLQDRDRHLPAARVLDVGTGSGAVIVALAAAWRDRFPAAAGRPEPRWQAVDLSAAALEVATANAQRSVPEATIAFVCADLWPEPVDVTFDLVLANLPYVGLDEADLLARDVRDHEPHEALFAGPDGLDCIRRLVADLPRRLAPGGAVGLEVGWKQAEAVARLLAEALPGVAVEIRKDLAGIGRLVCGRVPGGGGLVWTADLASGR